MGRQESVQGPLCSLKAEDSLKGNGSFNLGMVCKFI